MAQNNQPIFREIAEIMEREVRLYSRSILTPKFYEKTTSAEREAEIRKSWTEFLEGDLPRIDTILKQESWIWQEADESE